MKKISINDLPRLHKNSKIIYNQNGIIKLENNSSYQLEDYFISFDKLIMPNYNNSILSIDASISKYYGKEYSYNTFENLDKILESKEYRHIAIMLLDGLGSYLIESNLEENAFIKKHKVCDLNAVYPPTTACAIPALCSGKEPLATGWVGWSNYFSEVDKFVVMFRNQEYFTGESLNIDIEKDILPYKKFYEDFDTHVFELGPSFTPSNCQTFDEMCSRYAEKIKGLTSSFCYMYWGEPDTTMHINGACSNEAKEVFKDIDKTLEKLNENLSDDTLIIVTADHGHIDVKPIYLANFKDILSLLDRVPSNEGRCAFFKVKKFRKKKFVKLFNLYFADYFSLMSKKDFIEEGYLGNNIDLEHHKLKSFIGDYVAVAKKNYYFNFDLSSYNESDDEMIFKSHHAGITANEMVIPFILLKK